MKASLVVSALSLLGSTAAFGFFDKAENMGCKGPCEIKTIAEGISLECQECTKRLDLDNNVEQWGRSSGMINSCFTNKNGKLFPRDEGGGGGWDQSCKFKDVDAQGVIHADCRNDAQQTVAASIKLSEAPLAIESDKMWCECLGCNHEITP